MSEKPSATKPISALRRRMLEDMAVRKFGEKSRHDYIRHVETFAKFLGRSPDTATAEDLRRYQVHQTETDVGPPSINSAASALRFFFTITAGRAELPISWLARTIRGSSLVFSRRKRWRVCSRRRPALASSTKLR